MQRAAMRRAAGFTLVEAMTVLAIVAILAAIAYPGYADHVLRTRRVEGQVALLELMQQQERYFSQHNGYLAFSAESTGADEQHFRWWSGATAAASAYEMSALPCAGRLIAECVELRAMPGGAHVDTRFRDRACGMLTLSSTGEQKAAGSAAHCWP